LELSSREGVVLWSVRSMTHSVARMLGSDDDVSISCQPSIFENIEVTPGELVKFIILLVVALPTMGTGLFMAFFGEGIKTVILAGKAALLMGAPLLIPVAHQMIAEMEDIQDFDPSFVTGLAAGFLAVKHAVDAIIKAPPTVQAQFVGFNTGMLLRQLSAQKMHPPLLDSNRR